MRIQRTSYFLTFEQDFYEMLNLTNKEAVKEFEVETSTVKSTVILLQALLPNSTISHITKCQLQVKILILFTSNCTLHCAHAYHVHR